MPDSLLTRLLRRLSKVYEDRALDEIEKQMAEKEKLMAEGFAINASEGPESEKEWEVPEIAACYVSLLKKVYRGERPREVTLVPDDRLSLTVDGVRYDFKRSIRRYDRKSRMVMQEIEALFQDAYFSDVQSELLLRQLNN